MNDGNSQHLIPFFQPIVSFQTQMIYGYEALGRTIAEDGTERSLGPFFKDDSVGEEEHLKVDRFLREKAMQSFARAGIGAMLFFNLKPSWIYRHYLKSAERLPTLMFAKRNGVSPANIVIEITEEDFNGELEQLSEVIDLYRSAGCAIAIDDVGSGFSQLDRIALFKPNILKIDMNLLKKSAIHQGYRALLQSYSIVAEQMGASLLIEGVETAQDVETAFNVGARYAQGYLFSRAQPEFQSPDKYSAYIRHTAESFSRKSYELNLKSQSFEQAMNVALGAFTYGLEERDANRIVERLLPSLRNDCIRIYICRDDGLQMSANFSAHDGGTWVIDPAYQGTNWIWRPYFIPNILQMKSSMRGFLSQPYTDLDHSKTIRTFSYPLGQDLYIFLDFEFPS